MNIPITIKNLIKAQNEHDSIAYADCFSESGTMFDEGRTHTGRKEIGHWIAESIRKYKTIMKPLGFSKTATGGILSAEVSGTFSGSPIVLEFQFEIIDGLIRSLRISG